MLPPLYSHPSSQKLQQQSPSATQSWLPSASSTGKAAGGGPGLSPGQGPVWAGAGGGSGSGATADAGGGRPYAGGHTSGASSPPRLGGSAGSNRSSRSNRSGGSTRSGGRGSHLGGGGTAAAGASPSSPAPQDPTDPRGAHSVERQSQDPQGEGEQPPADGGADADADGDGGGDPQQEAQPPSADPPQPPQHPLLHSNNPYLQILMQAGAGLPAFAAGTGLAAAAQAAHEVQQAALRKRVQRDIKRMLAGNRAYQRHVKGPPELSAEALAALAQPKQRPGSRPDLEAVAHLPDPVEWARWKTDQLVISRLAEERRQAELAEEKQRQEGALTAFRQAKMEAKQARAEAKARAAAEEAAYRASMSSYLNHRGPIDLEEFKQRKDDQRERLALMRSRQVKGLAAHHY